VKSWPSPTPNPAPWQATTPPSVLSLRDGLFDTRATLAVTAVQTNAWIQADLGSAQHVAMVKLAPANDPTWPLDATQTNNTTLEYSPPTA